MRTPLVVALLLSTAASVGAQTIAPGGTASLQGETCATDQALLCGVSCAARCNIPEETAKISLILDGSAASLGSKWVVASVRSDFTVKPSDDGLATALDATIAYDIEWRGLWTIVGVATGFNDAKSEITLTLRDLSNGSVVRSVKVNEKDVDGFLDIDIVSVGAGTDRGSSVNSFSARVIRGRSYRLELLIRADAKGAPNAAITLDYIDPGLGAWWNSLRVTVGRDFAEEIEQLTRRVEALETHTHTYLTGKGEGHNNTEVETSTPMLEQEP